MRPDKRDGKGDTCLGRKKVCLLAAGTGLNSDKGKDTQGEGNPEES